MQHLQPYTTLQGGKYKIERVLGQGGFGNTYVGINTTFDDKVAIKEFFMQGINDRDDATGSVTVSLERNRLQFEEQREKFKKEALRIRKLDNPHIVKVHDLFEENGTVYYVMDFVDGENLAERLNRTDRPMSEQEVRGILPQILDALKTVHDAGIWHLDLKPANIMVDKSGNVKLIDFGASKQLNIQKGGATTSTAISYTNGYAPREQMEQNYDKFGPWTDIYALGATLYNLLTNKRPPLPTDIDDDLSNDKHLALPFPDNVSEEMKQMVLRMMKTDRNQRPQNVDTIEINFNNNPNQSELKKLCLSEDTIIEAPKTVTSNSSILKKESSNNFHIRKKSIYLLASGLIIIFLIIIGYFILPDNSINKIRIDAVLPSSSVDPKGPWIELKNITPSTCDIKGLYLTSDRSCLDPSMTKEERVKRMYLLSGNGEDIKLGANEQIVLYCNSNPSLGKNHLSFPIRASEPFWLAIYDKTASNIIDSVTIPALGEGEMYCHPDGSSWQICDFDVITSATTQNK